MRGHSATEDLLLGALLCPFYRLQLKCDGTRWRMGRKWMGNWRMEWVASTLHTTSEHGVSSITTADAHTSAASSRLNWRPFRFKWTRPFRRKTKSGFCACAIVFQLASKSSFTYLLTPRYSLSWEANRGWLHSRFDLTFRYGQKNLPVSETKAPSSCR